jgi:signal transduction histidine kinase
MIGRKFVESTQSPQSEHFLTESLTGKSVTFDIDCKCGVCEVTAVPFLDREGGKEILLVVRDVTSKRTAEHELIEALKRERELGELKSRFVTLASHEFRTPLTTILSSAFLIENYTGEKLEKEKNIHTTKIKRSVNLLTEILNDFLSLGKLEEGKMKPVYSDIQVSTFLEEVIKDVEPLKRTNQHFLVSTVGDETIRADRQMLRAILYNLISNACKYTHNDDEIVVHSHMENENIVFQVTDHGIGIPQEEQKNIFKRFFRANNAANFQGTGLGLNIAKKYVRLLNGTIDFISNTGRGTTFTVALPVSEKIMTSKLKKV